MDGQNGSASLQKLVSADKGNQTLHFNPKENMYFEVVFLLLVSVAGSIGNVLTLISGITDRRLKSMGLGLVLSLAVSDLLIAGAYLPTVVASILNGYESVFIDRWPACYAFAYLASWCTNLTAFSHAFLSVQRFAKAARPKAYGIHFSKARTAFMAGCAWLAGFLVSAPLLSGLSGSGFLLGYDRSVASCMWKDRGTMGYNVFLIVAVSGLPALVALSFYIATLRHMKATHRPTRQIASPNASALRASSQQRGRLSTDVSSGQEDSSLSISGGTVRTHHTRQNSINAHKTFRSKRSEERDRKLAQSLLAALVFFVLCRAPYLAKTMVTTPVSPVVNRACWWLALSGSAVNPILFALSNPDFRRAYKKSLLRLWEAVSCRARRDERQATSGSRKNSEYDGPSVKFG